MGVLFRKGLQSQSSGKGRERGTFEIVNEEQSGWNVGREDSGPK